jgi:hypothetical protein
MRHSVLNIPRSFDPNNAAKLKHDLERMATSLDEYTRKQSAKTEQVLDISEVTANGPVVAEFGRMTRVAPADGYVVVARLPLPERVNGGKTLAIARLVTTGSVLIVPSGALINGMSRVLMVNSISVVYVVFDGQNYFTENGTSIPWGDGLP